MVPRVKWLPGVKQDTLLIFERTAKWFPRVLQGPGRRRGPGDGFGGEFLSDTYVYVYMYMCMYNIHMYTHNTYVYLDIYVLCMHISSAEEVAEVPDVRRPASWAEDMD